MFFKFANFGGYVSLGGKRIPVSGKSFRKIAQFEAFWLSLAMPCDKVLYSLVVKCPEIATLDFVKKWKMNYRRHFFAKSQQLKMKLLKISVIGAWFETVQCLDGHYAPDEVDELLDRMSKKEFIEFYEDLGRKIEIASGVSSECGLSELLRITVKGNGENPDHTNESMMAFLIRHKFIGSPGEILDLTPAQASTLLTDPEKLEDDIALEAMVPEKGPEAKRNDWFYEEEAKKFFENYELTAVGTANVNIESAKAAS